MRGDSARASLGRALVGWVLMLLGLVVAVPGIVVVFMVLDRIGSLTAMDRLLVEATSGGGMLIAGALMLSGGAIVLTAAWHRPDNRRGGITDAEADT